jgi:hypothetical protein
MLRLPASPVQFGRIGVDIKVKGGMSVWEVSYRNDPKARKIADRHYNRQKIGSPGLVLYTENENGRALWVTSYPYAEYVKHEWAGAWVCSAFRNEGAGLASEMIIQAVAATRSYFGDPPKLGMITFLDRSKVKPTMVHGKKTWGYTWLKCGFEHVGETKGGLMALQLKPERMPEPCQAMLTQLCMF